MNVLIAHYLYNNNYIIIKYIFLICLIRKTKMNILQWIKITNVKCIFTEQRQKNHYNDIYNISYRIIDQQKNYLYTILITNLLILRHLTESNILIILLQNFCLVFIFVVCFYFYFLFFVKHITRYNNDNNDNCNNFSFKLLFWLQSLTRKRWMQSI